MNIIEINNLNKQFKITIRKNWIKSIFKSEYKIKKAVDNVSFTVKKGESVAFLGPNGAGKTTTTKMMTGLIYPTSGEISVLGFKPQDRNKEFLMKIGLVMGNKTGLNWDLTARQTFSIYQKIYKIPIEKYKSRLDKLSKLLNVDEHLDTPVRKLSLGERMKLELIGAILHDPEILFLDEPTIGLDIISKQNIRKFLREIQKDHGITLILTSHDMDDIELVCDRVLVINNGQLVFDNTIDYLKSNYNKDKYVKFYFDSIQDLDLNSYGEIYEQKDASITYKVAPTSLPQLISSFTSKNNVIDIDINSTPLEEMIKEIYEKK
ncbi:MAG: ATP-binding cassette domain-containing protein [bacterium]